MFHIFTNFVKFYVQSTYFCDFIFDQALCVVLFNNNSVA